MSCCFVVSKQVLQEQKVFDDYLWGKEKPTWSKSSPVSHKPNTFCSSRASVLWEGNWSEKKREENNNESYSLLTQTKQIRQLIWHFYLCSCTLMLQNKTPQTWGGGEDLVLWSPLPGMCESTIQLIDLLGISFLLLALSDNNNLDSLLDSELMPLIPMVHCILSS